MTEEDFLQIESSQRQHHEVMRHECLRRAAEIQEEMAIVAALHPQIYRDGDQWCVLYGQDIQTGIVGFGKTPSAAILDFNNAFGKTINE